MNDDLTSKIMDRIDAHRITPLPRWRFLLLRWAFWLLAALSVVLGGFSVGAMSYLFVDFHRHALWTTSHDVIDFLAMVPFLWIVALGAFVVIARIGLKHTRKGYKYQLRTLISGSIIASVMLGSILNVAGVGKITHELLKNIPAYDFLTEDAREASNRPTAGRLAGVVSNIQDNNNFFITDFTGRVWRVRVDTSKNNSFVPEASSTIRMFGLLESSTSVFIARTVHEWEE